MSTMTSKFYFHLQDADGRKFTVVLLDSEGIGAVTAEGSNDNQIFTLTVLLSSILIYNSKGIPKKTDLNELRYPFERGKWQVIS